PTGAAATASAAAAAKAAEAAAEAAAPAQTAAGPAAAAERADAARPAAPGSAAPEPPPSSTAAADPADDQNRDEDPEDRRQRHGRRVALARLRSRYGYAVERDASLLGDALDDARRAHEQAPAESSRGEVRRHHAARFAGEAVGDELLEVVADFDLDAPLLHREENQQPVVLALLSDAAAAVLEHLDGVFLGRAVWRDRRHGGDDDDVRGFCLQLADQLLHPPRAVGIDHVREVVDGLRQLGRKRG